MISSELFSSSLGCFLLLRQWIFVSTLSLYTYYIRRLFDNFALYYIRQRYKWVSTFSLLFALALDINDTMEIHFWWTIMERRRRDVLWYYIVVDFVWINYDCIISFNDFMVLLKPGRVCRLCEILFPSLVMFHVLLIWNFII